jgi:integrase
MARETVERNIKYDTKSKLYFVDLYYGMDESGKRIRKYKTFPSLKEARAALRAHEHSRDIGTMITPKETTLSEWLDYWLNDMMKPQLKPTTLYGYKQLIVNHIKPLLGSHKLQAIKPITVQKFYVTLMEEHGLSPNTVRKHHNLLVSAFKAAVKQEVLLKSPMDGVEPPKKIKREASVYTAEQMLTLFDKVRGTRLEPLVMLCAYLGLRREEACGLSWSDIDYETQTIRIVNTRTMAGGVIIEGDTKTDESTRKLHMTDDLAEFLRKEQARQNANRASLGDAYAPGDYILVWDDGQPYRPNYLSELFTKFLKKHNLPKIVLHEIRHTFASLSNEAGVQDFNIGKALGHSTPSTTKKIYMHLFDQKHTAAMEAVAAILHTEREKDE